MASVLPLRVFVVDGFPDYADGLVGVLRLWGHEAATACDAPGALAVAAEFLPDVALLDVGLPGLGGYELARRLRELPGLIGVVLVAMTDGRHELCREESATSGFAFHFVKSPDLRGLEALLVALARQKEKPAAP